jgi:3',5'-cyclic AMP phosphodiesterase CpdA
MQPLKLAVVSDLHVGAKARATDLCPHPDPVASESGYRANFVSFLLENEITADYLILPGDVSNAADPSEFELASEIVKEIAETLKLAFDRIVFVPGNHDVDWSVLKSPDPTGFRRTQRYAPLTHPSWIFHQILTRCVGGVITDGSYFGSWMYPDLVVVGYNSSFDDDPLKSVHHGLVAQKHLKDLDLFLQTIDLSSSRLRVFLVHHHPLQYSDPVPDEPDFSAMTNAQNLLAVLQKHQFDLLIHGHKHCPQFDTYSVGAGFPLAVLCAGSFSIILDTRWHGYVNNQFHLVTVEGREAAASTIYGVVESWAYLAGNGWLPSSPSNGITHKVPFGTYVQPNVLMASLQPIIEQAVRDKGFVTWTSIVTKRPELQFLPALRITETLDRISTKLSLRRVGDPPDEVVLLSTGGV